MNIKKMKMNIETIDTKRVIAGNDSSSPDYEKEENHSTNYNFEAIAQSYDLGAIIREPRLEQGGLVNNNYVLETTNGTYMVRTQDKKMSDYEVTKKSLEYAVTDHLNESDFDYQVPSFLKNAEGERLSEIEGKTVEVYERLPGNPRENTTLEEKTEETDDMIEALAKYHKAIENFPTDTKPEQSSEVYDKNEWLYGRLKSIEQTTQDPKTEVDYFMKDNMDFLINTYNDVKENAIPNAPSIVIHDDMHGGNVLYDEGKLTGVIDFGNVHLGTKEKDLAKLAKDSLSEIENVIEKYRVHNSLTDKEAGNILPEYIFNTLSGIRWVYEGMNKNPELREVMLKKRIDRLHEAMNLWENQTESKVA